jgi:hypothetical protein
MEWFAVVVDPAVGQVAELVDVNVRESPDWRGKELIDVALRTNNRGNSASNQTHARKNVEALRHRILHSEKRGAQ